MVLLVFDIIYLKYEVLWHEISSDEQMALPPWQCPVVPATGSIIISSVAAFDLATHASTQSSNGRFSMAGFYMVITVTSSNLGIPVKAAYA